MLDLGVGCHTLENGVDLLQMLDGVDTQLVTAMLHFLSARRLCGQRIDSLLINYSVCVWVDEDRLPVRGYTFGGEDMGRHRTIHYSTDIPPRMTSTTFK